MEYTSLLPSTLKLYSCTNKKVRLLKFFESKIALTYNASIASNLANLIWNDVLPNDENVAISVWSGVFMPEPNYVAQLMNNDTKFIAVVANRNCLRPISSFPHERTASARSNLQVICFCCVTLSYTKHSANINLNLFRTSIKLP